MFLIIAQLPMDIYKREKEKRKRNSLTSPETHSRIDGI